MDRLRLLGLLGDTWRRPRDPRSAALEVCRLIDRFRSKPREFLSILIVAVLARLQRHSKQSRGAVVLCAYGRKRGRTMALLLISRCCPAL